MTGTGRQTDRQTDGQDHVLSQADALTKNSQGTGLTQRPETIPGLVNHFLKIVTSSYEKFTMVPRWVKDSPFFPKVLGYLATQT